MPLTVLSNEQLRSLLLSLTRDEVLQLQKNLAQALREYSTGSQDKGCSADYQPQRTAITRKDGSSTIFMPASTGSTMGIKIISLQSGGKAGYSTGSATGGRESRVRFAPEASRDSRPSIGSDISRLSISSQEDSDISNVPSASINNRPLSPVSSTSSASRTGLSSTSGAWFGAGTRDTSPPGTVTLLDSNSIPFGIIRAQELTAFRTALASLMLFNRRKKAKTITVFGAGKQAYWHIRLALVLRDDIKRVYIINRSFERAAELLKDIYDPENTSWRRNVKFSAFSSDFVESERLLKEAVRKADAIFCCTPSTAPLFPAEFLTSSEGRRKGRLVCAIGSYKPHMTELHPDVLRDEVTPHHSSHHHHKHARRSGVIVVDTLDACLQEAGEIVQAGVTPQQLVELGELMMVREAARLAMEQGGEEEKGLLEWIESGNVIFKSVGLGLMDLVTGGDLIKLAQERGVGTTVEEF
ncbi:hypothetical protein DTO164E3_4415 [Paecilomyces variotii]|nr:hypothetical protein DTO164E3_4415 [Paecilomyces variotii]KAJ9286966.1 hypothetical protein DTO021C3_5486 [Paecilomyces variotii]KAJ9403849.1 hypothetical protein DTO045G8_8412 [Paecilomyces variotii]